jgi:methylase of polypeptide subunit release factors
MRAMKTTIRHKLEFGDFQTPLELSTEICHLLHQQGVQPRTLIEPTCGKGNFIVSALRTFDDLKQIIGLDINPGYLQEVTAKLPKSGLGFVKLLNKDIFNVDWDAMFANVPQPVLIIGNPPWVTNARLGILNSNNLPAKSNFNANKGLDALTGKSNFDISEWMLLRICEWAQNKNAIVAMLCKTTVARKILRHVWKNNLSLSNFSIYQINTKRYFCVYVSACLFICRGANTPVLKKCNVYDGLSDENRVSLIGMHKSELLADIEKYERWAFLNGPEEHYKWRSGLKHDCSAVMEFAREVDGLKNNLGKFCDIEPDFIYPLYKGSDVAQNHRPQPRRYVLVTQKNTSEDTRFIQQFAPKTWDYLQRHAEYLDKRKSTVYKGRPRFCLFGIGDYAFSLWKVAICGLYKKLHFSVIGPSESKPVMLDDTCYYIPCKTEGEAVLIEELLNSQPAREFLDSLIFWDSKRPITSGILQRLNLLSLAQHLGKSNALEKYLDKTLLDLVGSR